MGPFNNREIATAFWLLIFLAWALRKPNIRKSLAGLVRAFCRFKIIAAVCVMLLYTVAVVGVLAAFCLWNIALLKDTIVWFCVSAVVMMVRFGTSDESENIFRKVLVDSLKVVIVLEFLANTYTFSLPAELVITPVVTLIAMISAFAASDEKYSVVARLSQGVQTVIVLAILAIVFVRAISDLRNLLSLDTVRNIALAPLLSLLLCPFLYVLVLISKYELVFVRLDLGTEKDRTLRRYARRRIIMYAGLSLRRLHHLLRNRTIGLTHIETESDVDRLLRMSKDS
jgi:hypothetical protein